MKRIIIIVILLCSIHFWRFDFIPEKFHKLTDLISLGILGFGFIRMIPDKSLRFRNAIILFLIGIFFNIISAYFNNGQSMKDTFLSFGPYYFILFYFFLHLIKPDKEDLENIIIAFGLIYAVFYLYQAAKFPEQIFEGAMYRDRGTIRIRIEGSGFLMLAYFLLLNRYLMKRNIMHVILALFLFLVLIKGGFRTLILGGILISGVVFIKLIKYSVLNYVLIFVAVILFIGLFQLPSTSSILEGMIQTSETQLEQGDKYIRFLQYDYFSKVYPQNFSYYIFGGGLPGGYGSYSRYMGYMTHRYGFYWVDLGLIGFYYVIGLLALLGILWYTIKAIFTRVPAEYFYLKIYFAYLVIVSITTMEIYRPGIFAIEAIALYMIDLVSSEEVSSEDDKISINPEIHDPVS